MNEKLIDKKLREAIKRAGGLAIKFFCPTFTGLPDRIVFMPGGRVWLVELKSPGKPLSPRQKIVHPQLRALGLNVRKIDRQEQLDELLNEITA